MNQSNNTLTADTLSKIKMYDRPLSDFLLPDQIEILARELAMQSISLNEEEIQNIYEILTEAGYRKMAEKLKSATRKG